MGNRIDSGHLPALVSEALPPLSETALAAAGQQLDALSETRTAQQGLEQDTRHVGSFLEVYRRYSAGILHHAGEAAGAAAAGARTAATTERRASDDHAAASRELEAATQRRLELEGQEKELDGAVLGIRVSRAYQAITELDDKGARVLAIAATAERALGHAEGARSLEAQRVAEADGRADEVTEAAATTERSLDVARTGMQRAGLAVAALPLTAAARRVAVPAAAGPVRTTLRDEPILRQSRGPDRLEVLPSAPASSAEEVRRAGTAAGARADQAQQRLRVARELDEQRRRVEAAQAQAEDADVRLESAEEAASGAEETRDIEAVGLVSAWHEWTERPDTIDLLGPVDWRASPLGSLLADPDLLIGPFGDSRDLDELDRSADAAATAARQAVADERAALRAERALNDQRRAELDDEIAALRAARDPEPAVPPWQTAAPEGGVPLWRAVDFADPELDKSERAGIEAALLGAGLLTAHLCEDGTVVATDGQVLLTSRGPRVEGSLTEVLVPDPACSLAANQVTEVLERIALDDPERPVWICRDGRWGVGPLTGRHAAETARHIGAEARAAARAARLQDIADELAALDSSDVALKDRRLHADAILQGLDGHVGTAPRSAALRQSRAVAIAARRDAGRAAEQARAARGTAERLGTEYRTASAMHAEACRAFDLPADTLGIDSVREAATAAESLCAALADHLDRLAVTIRRHESALALARAQTDSRAGSEHAAEADVATWRVAAAELAALEQVVGSDAETVRAELQAAETELDHTRRLLAEARDAESKRGNWAIRAEEYRRTAGERLDEARNALVATVARLHHLTELPGLGPAASGTPELRVTLPLADVALLRPGVVDAAVRSLDGALDLRGGPADGTAILRAQHQLERDLTGTFDVVARTADDVLLFDLVDANGSHTVPSAYAELQRREALGRSALTDRERQVFSQFLLGGVSEELQRRLRQADQLVGAMNESLRTIRTSHGIGVRVRWSFTAADESTARIHELVTLAAEVRGAARDTELVDLLTARVAEQHAADPTVGYAVHLRSALDYRAWHEVEVLILGPARDQQRRISRRSKLSQGETRFVSYVTLFAAIDAYLSGLPDTSRSLRLLVLDDAFAKVDDPTIAELMGLLVRLDIDFAMTGHALWGCYPQVPALDVYEVRRMEGRAAVTTHIHWDGRTRHLRVSR